MLQIKLKLPLLILLQFTLLAPALLAELSDKAQYTLFNPVPESLLREMSTDRPDTTESPYSLDAGHFQFEFSLINFSHNKDNGVKTDTTDWMPMNIKAGLTDNIDLQFVFTPYVYEQETIAGEESTLEGFGDDTQFRLKINMWGNDTEGTAFALMPYIKIPTGHGDLSNDHVEGGLIIPYALDLDETYSLGIMLTLDSTYNSDSEEYQFSSLHSATVSQPLGADFSAYLEYFGITPENLHGSYQANLSAGVTYELCSNWILDAGMVYGLSEQSDDYSMFTGMSYRM